jgi:hypothetical protein
VSVESTLAEPLMPTAKPTTLTKVRNPTSRT